MRIIDENIDVVRSFIVSNIGVSIDIDVSIDTDVYLQEYILVDIDTKDYPSMGILLRVYSDHVKVQYITNNSQSSASSGRFILKLFSLLKGFCKQFNLKYISCNAHRDDDNGMIGHSVWHKLGFVPDRDAITCLWMDEPDLTYEMFCKLNKVAEQKTGIKVGLQDDNNLHKFITTYPLLWKEIGISYPAIYYVI